jgi:hypothetical protein
MQNAPALFLFPFIQVSYISASSWAWASCCAGRERMFAGIKCKCWWAHHRSHGGSKGVAFSACAKRADRHTWLCHCYIYCDRSWSDIAAHEPWGLTSGRAGAQPVSNCLPAAGAHIQRSLRNSHPSHVSVFVW